MSISGCFPSEASTKLIALARDKVPSNAPFVKALIYIAQLGFLWGERKSVREILFPGWMMSPWFLLYFGGPNGVLPLLYSHQYRVLFFLTEATPHSPLSKGPDDGWRDLGPFLINCLFAGDWQTDEQGCFFFPSLNVHKTDFPSRTPVFRSIYLTDSQGRDSQDHYFTGFAEISELPEKFSEVPASLWDTHKYDVGLIKGAEPVKIIPKIDFRPNQPHYLLKPEAVEGITPVFNSLLVAGVNCSMSRICAPPKC